MVHIQVHPYLHLYRKHMPIGCEVKFYSHMCCYYIIASKTMANCWGNSTKPSWAMRILSDGVYTSSSVTLNLLCSKASWDRRRSATLPSKTCTVSPLGYITCKYIYLFLKSIHLRTVSFFTFFRWCFEDSFGSQWVLGVSSTNPKSIIHELGAEVSV